MDERYGKAESQAIEDTKWIEEAALAGDILLCKDLSPSGAPGDQGVQGLDLRTAYEQRIDLE
jgi:hypothetical protein